MKKLIPLFLLLSLSLAACQPAQQKTGQPLKVVAAESFLADIAQQVAGSHLTVTSLMPDGTDPHTWQPAPKDVALIAETDLFIVNGGELETWLTNLVKNAGGDTVIVSASEGLQAREVKEDEHDDHAADEHAHGIDPHFWLDPNLVITYAANIEQALSQHDPQHALEYKANADAYVSKLRELDQYIRQKTDEIPAERRQLVTTHESLGYFADRYGFTLVGTIIPGFSSDAEPSARDLAALVDLIRSTGARAIFLEQGGSTKLADQLAAETGIKVITNLHTHSILSNGQAGEGYLGMMRHNIDVIAEALK